MFSMQNYWDISPPSDPNTVDLPANLIVPLTFGQSRQLVVIINSNKDSFSILSLSYRSTEVEQKYIFLNAFIKEVEGVKGERKLTLQLEGQKNTTDFKSFSATLNTQYFQVQLDPLKH